MGFTSIVPIRCMSQMPVLRVRRKLLVNITFHAETDRRTRLSANLCHFIIFNFSNYKNADCHSFVPAMKFSSISFLFFCCCCWGRITKKYIIAKKTMSGTKICNCSILFFLLFLPKTGDKFLIKITKGII